MQDKTGWSSFTNKYSLSKTLRFELKPVGNTQKMLEDDGVFQKDRERQENYKKVKPFMDKLHREFIKEALNNLKLEGLTEYFEIFKKFRKDKNNKELKNAEKKLRQIIGRCYTETAQIWVEKYKEFGFKKKNIGFLFEEGVFELMKLKYGNDEASQIEKNGEVLSIFDGWKGFLGYFKKFFETRNNFYKDDGTSTAVSTRIINENLKIYLDNLIKYNKIKDKVDFKEADILQENKLNLSDFFNVESYAKYSLQKGIDYYNEILGGKTLKNGTKLKGLNEVINEYKQKNKSGELSKFKMLKKQILGEGEDRTLFEEIENEDELKDVLKDFFYNADPKITLFKTLLEDFFSNTEKYKDELDKIYFNTVAINGILHRWVDDSGVFQKYLFEVLKSNKLVKSNHYDKKEDSYKFPDFISFEHIKVALENCERDGLKDKFWKEKYYTKECLTENGLANLWQEFLEIYKCEFKKLYDYKTDDNDCYLQYRDNYKKYILDANFNPKEKSAKDIIKDYLDSVLSIYQLAKYFALEKKKVWTTDYETGDFYYEYIKFYEDTYEQIIKPYNLVRNYLTRKPINTAKKWKLNFDNAYLASGWDKDKEVSNLTVILRRDEQYYLAIMKKGKNKIFEKKFSCGEFEKMEYKQIAEASSDIHNLVLMNDGSCRRCIKMHDKRKYWPLDISIIKEKKSYAKENFVRRDFERFVNYMKKCSLLYWKEYDLKFSDTSTYKNINDFTNEIASQGYKLSFSAIPESYINEKNNNGELYLFQIYNKDFGIKTEGNKNLHTMYWESIFSEENRFRNFIVKLNGKAEIFYRPKSEQVEKEQRNFTREIIKNRRYTENKIYFHCPITLNRISRENVKKFNNGINNYIATNPNINILGVDRGEKHLVYYAIVDQDGKLIDAEDATGSFNTIGSTDYHRLLEEKAKDREKERKDWDLIRGIKDLKKGYISLVVRKIADLAIKYNAIIIFEDLNTRFKQIRGGMEKSVYQQLEKALINKLSFLVNKGEKDPEQAGHLLKAYQLAAPFQTFDKMGRQTGIIFYTQASYTSKIDPITGWRPNLYLKYRNIDDSKESIKKFKSILFNKEKNRFEFTYDLKDFVDFEEDKIPEKTEWTLCSSVERHKWNRHMNNNKGGYEVYKDLTENFYKLFDENNISMNKDIVDQVESISNGNFFRQFIYLFNLVCQIRNTDEKAEDVDKRDFILSPVEPFFDSRRAKDFKAYGDNLPKNGDENGAYNIARKGVLIIKKIKEYYNQNGSCDKLGWGDLSISHKEWDDFATNN